ANCTFSGNSAEGNGGGMGNDTYSNPTLTNCTFSGNRSGGAGAGICNTYNSSPTLANCTFTGNSAEDDGGGMYNWVQSEPTLTNCILWLNSDAGGMDESAQIHNAGGTTAVDYSCIQGWTGSLGGVGNIGDYPQLVAGYYLAQRAAGQPVESLCVDAGDPTSEMIDGTTRTDGVQDAGVVDMGYHYPGPACFGDMNGDGARNITDFTLFASAYGSQVGDANFNPYADLTGNGYVNMTDFTVFAPYYGVPCP
ncbi:unnamed protein product, partial [marine sediment metagenome]